MLLIAQPITRESAMHEPSQARAALSAVPHDERTRALARYKIIQPHVEQGVPLAPLVH